MTTDAGIAATVVGTTSQAETGGVHVYNFTVSLDHTYFVQAGTGLGIDAVWVHNDCAGFHHFYPVALGSEIPYADQGLTYLAEAEHTAVQGDLNAFLREQTGVNAAGDVVDMMPRALSSGELVMQNFSPDERLAALMGFYEGYQGGKYFANFAQEVGYGLAKGWIE